MQWMNICLVTALLITPIRVLADQDREQERLSLLAEQIGELVDHAEQIRRQEAENRYPRFRYDLLQSDLTRVRQGIHDYIGRVIDSTRSLDPITGEYLLETATEPHDNDAIKKGVEGSADEVLHRALEQGE